MRSLAVFAFLLCWAVPLANVTDTTLSPAVTDGGSLPAGPPHGIQLFALHDPELASTWPGFLASTPMINDEPLPVLLQNRLANVVATYQLLTPIDQPAFFVATYFDLLSERLLSAVAETGSEILPMQVCPVFVNDNDAPVSSLLAVASGLPDKVFEHAPGVSEHYRFLFLQTEYSHCRFLASIRAANEAPLPLGVHSVLPDAATVISFDVGERSYTAELRTKEELRALLETVGEVDATAQFRRYQSVGPTRDEAEVLSFVRLLSLLATDGRSGYAAIPVLYPLLDESVPTTSTAGATSLRVADALDLAYRVRSAFRQIVPFAIRDTEQLLNAKLRVMRALALGGSHRIADDRTAALLQQFVEGADLLLTTTVAHKKMPLVRD